MRLEKVDLTSKGARKLDSFTSRINTDDYYLVKTDKDYWKVGRFMAPGIEISNWWKFSSSFGPDQLSYRSDNLLDKSYVEVYRIVDEDLIAKRAIDVLSK